MWATMRSGILRACVHMHAMLLMWFPIHKDNHAEVRIYFNLHMPQ